MATATLSKPARAVDEKAVARQWEKVQEMTEAAKVQWAKVLKETAKLARLAHLGRKKSVLVRISEIRGVEITNQFKGEDQVFTAAFAKRLQAKEVKLESPSS